MAETKALHTLMYRQNMDAHFRSSGDAGPTVYPIGPLARALRSCHGAATRNFCDTTELTTSGHGPVRGVARPRAGQAALTITRTTLAA